jgi:hypothetical protein
MSWLKENLQTLLPVLIGLAWVAQMVGPAALRSLRKASSAAWPKIRPKLTAKNLALPVVAGLIAATRLIPSPQPVEPPKPPDLFAQCGANARALLADEFESFAAQRFDSVEEKEDAINQKITDVIASTFQPLRTQVAKAIKENRLVDYARKIKAGEADEQ